MEFKIKKHIFEERRKECTTDTQYIVMLSGYYWAERQFRGTSNMVILDAACGTGYGSNYLAEKGYKVIVIDISPKAINFAIKKYKKTNLTFLIIDCRNLNFPDSMFDAVISQDTIEHISEDKKFLEEIVRVLKPSGKAIIFTPYSKTRTEKPLNPFHVREYSYESFKNLLQVYFSDVKIYGRKFGKELREVENEFNKIRKFDKFYFRLIIPEKIRHFIGNIILKLKRKLTLDKISFKHIIYTEEIDDEVVTLVAVCKK